MILSFVITLGVIVGGSLLISSASRRLSTDGQTLSRVDRNNRTGSSAREILGTRYARGEITQEQYKEMITDLDTS